MIAYHGCFVVYLCVAWILGLLLVDVAPSILGVMGIDAASTEPNTEEDTSPPYLRRHISSITPTVPPAAEAMVDDEHEEEEQAPKRPHDNDEKKKQLRIVNGEIVSELRYPYFALLGRGAYEENTNDFVCGAVLIGPRIVLGVAHCDDQRIEYLRVGAYKDYLDGRQIPIADRIVHPAYSESEFTNDLVIYRLDDEIDLPYYIELEPPPSTTTTTTNNNNIEDETESLTVLGFGDTNPYTDRSWKPDYSTMLRQVTLEVVDNETCNNKYYGNQGMVSDGMLCAYGDGQREASYKDSGGPLIRPGASPPHDTLVGLVSWGATLDEPGVYTRISYYYEWIRRKVCNQWPYDAPYYMKCFSKESLLYHVITNITLRPTPKLTNPPPTTAIITITISPPPTTTTISAATLPPTPVDMPVPPSVTLDDEAQQLLPSSKPTSSAPTTSPTDNNNNNNNWDKLLLLAGGGR